jgi:hypothetical protein
MIFPTILILGIEKILDGATLGTLIGGLVGYVLSGVGEYKPRGDKPTENSNLDTTGRPS